MRTSKAISAGSCLLGLLACWLMWGEAGLPPKDRPLRLFGPSGGTWITNNPHPESCLAFAGGLCMITLLGVLGLFGREDNTPEWLWSPAFIALGVFLALFLHQARRVNGTDMGVVQPGHLLGLLASVGILVSGILAFVAAWRASCKTARRSDLDNNDTRGL